MVVFIGFFLFRSPSASTNIAPPLFSLVSLSNSLSEILKLVICLAAIAPAVLFACKFLNLELEISYFTLSFANIAAAYFEVVLKKSQLSIVAFVM